VHLDGWRDTVVMPSAEKSESTERQKVH